MLVSDHVTQLMREVGMLGRLVENGVTADAQGAGVTWWWIDEHDGMIMWAELNALITGGLTREADQLRPFLPVDERARQCADVEHEGGVEMNLTQCRTNVEISNGPVGRRRLGEHLPKDRQADRRRNG